MNAETMNRLGLRAGSGVRLRQGGGEAIAAVALDERVPSNCIRISAGHRATAGLGALLGPIEAAAAELDERKAG